MNEAQTKTKLEHTDIICLTKSYPKIASGYDLLCTDVGRGIVMNTTNHLIAKHIETKITFEESSWCNIKITVKHHITFVDIYSGPPSGNNNMLLSVSLHKVIQIDSNHIIVSVGFNLKETDWESRQVNGFQDSKPI